MDPFGDRAAKPAEHARRLLHASERDVRIDIAAPRNTGVPVRLPA
jgi:hypothetical protein